MKRHKTIKIILYVLFLLALGLPIVCYGIVAYKTSDRIYEDVDSIPYNDRSCPIGFDIDAGPIIFGLSPSGTAFATGAVTYFADNDVRTQILRTAEKAGHTILWNGKRHYALANVAIVGKAIMLAMRTHYKENTILNKK